MNPLAIDPTQTFTFSLLAEDGKPFANDISATCRYLTMRQALDFRGRFDEALKLPDIQATPQVLAIVRPYVVRIDGLPEGAAVGVDGLLDILTPRQFFGFIRSFHDRQYVAEIDLGKSLLPQPSAAAVSAGSAGVGGA